MPLAITGRRPGPRVVDALMARMGLAGAATTSPRSSPAASSSASSVARALI